MEMVACPQCGGKVPPGVPTCPTCGARIPHERAWKATELGGVVILVAGVATATLGSVYGSPSALYAGLGGAGLGVATYAAGWVMGWWRQGRS